MSISKATITAGLALAAAGAVLLDKRGVLQPPEVCPTIYGDPDGLRAQLDRALPFLAPLEPGGVMLHTSLEDIRDNAAARVARVRQFLPNAAVWFGTTGDEHYNDVQSGAWTVDRLQALRVNAAIAAAAAGATTLEHNCEAAWKHNAPGFRSGDAADMIAMIRARVPKLQQWLTSYYAPTLHAAFPWRGFVGVDGYSPQIYFEDGGGDAAFARFVNSWRIAMTQGWVNPKAFLAAYLRCRAGTGTVMEQSKISDYFGTLNFWWLMGGCDAQGQEFIAALCKLRKLGFVGQDRIARFQRSRGLVADSKIGPLTLAAINAA